MNEKRKIAFLGSDEIALPCLNALLESPENWEICGVLTQPDRRSGRGRNLRSNPIKKWAIEQGIPVQDPQRPGKEEADWLKHLGADLTLVMAYGHILKNDLLNTHPVVVLIYMLPCCQNIVVHLQLKPHWLWEN